MKRRPADEDAAALEAGRAAGYCWATRRPLPGLCTRSPGHDDDHADYYNGRRKVTDVVGYTWPQKKPPVTGAPIPA